MFRFLRLPNHRNAYLQYRLPTPRAHQRPRLSSKNLPNRMKRCQATSSYVHDQRQIDHIEDDYQRPPGVKGAVDRAMLYSIHLFLVVALRRLNEFPAHSEHVVGTCAGTAIGRNAMQAPGALFVRAMGSAKEAFLDAVTVMTCCYVVPHPVGGVVVFSPKYHSGVPCLSAFRFPAPQNGADIAPFSLIVLNCFAERGFNPFRRIQVGSIFQFIC